MYKTLKKLLLKTDNKNPIEIFISLVSDKSIPMHGPIHHFIDGACLLVAIYNAGVDFDLSIALDELYDRSKMMPGATCGMWGVCGSAASIGAALSILHDTGPLSDDIDYKKHMALVSKILCNISTIGGPRCCKRNAFISLSTAIKFLKSKYGIKFDSSNIKCHFSHMNKQCIGKKCPYKK